MFVSLKYIKSCTSIFSVSIPAAHPVHDRLGTRIRQNSTLDFVVLFVWNPRGSKMTRGRSIKGNTIESVLSCTIIMLCIVYALRARWCTMNDATDCNAQCIRVRRDVKRFQFLPSTCCLARSLMICEPHCFLQARFWTFIYLLFIYARRYYRYGLRFIRSGRHNTFFVSLYRTPNDSNGTVLGSHTKEDFSKDLVWRTQSLGPRYTWFVDPKLCSLTWKQKSTTFRGFRPLVGEGNPLTFVLKTFSSVLWYGRSVDFHDGLQLAYQL